MLSLWLSLKTKDVLLKIKEGLMKTEDLLLKTKDGLLKLKTIENKMLTFVYDAHKNRNKSVISIAHLCLSAVLKSVVIFPY